MTIKAFASLLKTVIILATTMTITNIIVNIINIINIITIIIEEKGARRPEPATKEIKPMVLDVAGLTNR